MSTARRPIMSADDTFFMVPDELASRTAWKPAQQIRQRLSPSQAYMYKKYAKRVDCTDKLIFDCSQDPDTHKCTEGKDGLLQTFTTNCGAIVSKKHQRAMAVEEVMTNMGVPVLPRAAAAAGVRVWEFPLATSRTNMLRMAGNGMHVPCGGVMIMLAMTCVDDIR